MAGKLSRIIEDILRRPDPQGYYVILLKSSVQKELVDSILEEYRSEIVVRTRSRRVAREITRLALRIGVLEPM